MKWTPEKAMARIRNKGCSVNEEKKQIFVEAKPGIGNSTLGALDYLKKHVKYAVIFGKEM